MRLPTTTSPRSDGSDARSAWRTSTRSATPLRATFSLAASTASASSSTAEGDAGSRASPRQWPARRSRSRDRARPSPASVDLLQRAQAQARRFVMAGAESHRRFDDDEHRLVHRGVVSVVSSAARVGRASGLVDVPGRRDDQPPDRTARQARLRTLRPLFVGYVDDGARRGRRARRRGPATAAYRAVRPRRRRRATPARSRRGVDDGGGGVVVEKRGKKVGEIGGSLVSERARSSAGQASSIHASAAVTRTSPDRDGLTGNRDGLTGDQTIRSIFSKTIA